MKAIKFLLKAILWIAALVVVALLAMPLWFGPVVKTAANIAAPRIVKTDFHMGHLHLNPYTARFELGDMQLFNPTGYAEKYAVTLGDIKFDAETFSLMTDVIHIEEISIKDVFVSVVSGGENEVLNFKQIQYNVAGGKEKYEAAQAEKKACADAQQPQAAETDKEACAQQEKPEKKIIIDKFHLSGLKVQLGFLPISLPVELTLTDIGRKSGGATVQEAWQQIWAEILKAAGVAGEQLKALGNLTGDAAKQATEAASKAAAQTTEAMSKASSAMSESATKAAGDATKAAGDAAKAAGDAANKAIDSLKKLW